MRERRTEDQQPDTTHDEAKRVARLKLEADVHAFLEAMAAVGVPDEEALELARSAVRSALGGTYAGQMTREWRRRPSHDL